MKFLKRRRGATPYHKTDDDLMAGVTNLFDVALVFIVALVVVLFNVYRLDALLDEDSEVTIVREAEDGQLEIITKQGKKLEASRVTKTEAKGRGQRLGTAYKLEDGTMIYVPTD